MEAIFRQDQLKNHSDYYLQTFLYSVIVARNSSLITLHSSLLIVSPALLFIQHAKADDYNPVLKFGKDYINDVAPYAEQFMSLLTQVIDEIFDPATSFLPTEDRTRCTNCPFRQLCQ